MSRKLPPLNWLRAFEMSAKHLNFTLAANELNRTQASISQQIKGLEAQLGVTLFKRLPRGLELTQAGRSYIPVVRDAIESLIIATDELFSKNNTANLTIKTSLVYLTHWLIPRLADFYQQHPNIKLTFSSYIWTEEQRSSADLEIRHGLGKWPGFIAHRLSWDALVPVCSPSYLNNFQPQRTFTLNDLKECQLINVIGYNEGWGHWCHQHKIDGVNINQCLQFDSLIPALALASQGQGIALGRTCLIEKHLENNQLITPLREQLTTNEAFYLIQKETNKNQTASTIFRTWLLDQIPSAT